MRVQKFTDYARLPRELPNGQYEIYSSEVKHIVRGRAVPVKTDIAIAVPVGFYPLILSNRLVLSHQIHVSSYNNGQDTEHKFNSSVGRIYPLEIVLENRGMVDYTVDKGDTIATLMIIRQRNFAVVEVEDINADYTVEPSSLIQPKIKALPKTAMIWFKRMYVDNPTDVIRKYVPLEVVEALEEYKTSEDYLIARHKTNVEANELWRQLCKLEGHKKRIDDDFAIFRESIVAGSSAPAPTPAPAPAPAPASQKGKEKIYDVDDELTEIPLEEGEIKTLDNF
jgi:dUTPase